MVNLGSRWIYKSIFCDPGSLHTTASSGKKLESRTRSNPCIGMYSICRNAFFFFLPIHTLEAHSRNRCDITFEDAGVMIQAENHYWRAAEDLHGERSSRQQNWRNLNERRESNFMCNSFDMNFAKGVQFGFDLGETNSYIRNYANMHVRWRRGRPFC